MDPNQHIAEYYEKNKDRLIKRAAHRVGPDDAEDVVQELFFRITKSYKNWEPSKGRFSRWIESIFKRCIFDLLNKRRNYTNLFTSSYEELPEHLEPTYEDNTPEVNEQIEKIYSKIIGMRRPAKDILYMYFFLGYSMTEIRDQLVAKDTDDRTSYKTVQRTISRFRDKF